MTDGDSASSGRVAHKPVGMAREIQTSSIGIRMVFDRMIAALVPTVASKIVVFAAKSDWAHFHAAPGIAVGRMILILSSSYSPGLHFRLLQMAEVDGSWASDEYLKSYL